MKILGVGGHSKVVIDAAEEAGYLISEIYDDDPNTHEKEIEGHQVVGSITSSLKGEAVIAIGSNNVRQNIDQRLTDCSWQTIIHPSATIAGNVRIGEGSVIMAGTVLQPGIEIGRHVIINTGACIDHDCTIGDYSHIAPNCSMAGGISIGEGTLLGIGSSVIQGISIGDWAVIGTGSVVINDLPGRCTAVGNPCKVI